MTFKIKLACLSVALPSAALANPHPLPHTYGYGTAPRDAIELEQFVDLTPTEVPGGAFELVPRLSTEVEVGLSDRLELGLYVVSAGALGADGVALNFHGIRQRLRLRLAEAGTWPIDVSLYAEVSELHDAFEIEGKINFERRFGAVDFLLNLSAARELYWSGGGETELNPSGGVAFELSPSAMLGLEYRLDGEFAEGESEIGHWLGPAAMWQGKSLWWTVSPSAQLGAEEGEGLPLKFRTAIGIDL